MRIARVLQATSPGAPLLALERDGALYSVAELDRVFDTRFSPERFPSASDFHTRVVALACAGLDELDAELKQGHRPTEARLLPDAFLWLAPCATERAAYVQLGPCRALSDRAGREGRPDLVDEPEYRFGNARGLLGHDTAIAFPHDEGEPDFEIGVAVLLRDDLRRATPAEAERAILGYTTINAWTARELERRANELHRAPSRARDFGTQLGPVLVTKNEIPDVAALRAQIGIGNETVHASSVGEASYAIAEAIAYVSQNAELCAGDVIGIGCLVGGSAAAHGRRLRYGTPIEGRIERLGNLRGRPTRGPEPLAWRT